MQKSIIVEMLSRSVLLRSCTLLPWGPIFSFTLRFSQLWDDPSSSCFGESSGVVGRERMPSPMLTESVSDGTLRANSLQNFGVITGFGTVDVLTNSSWQNNGRVDAAGGRLLIDGTSSSNLQNNGSISANGGELNAFFVKDKAAREQ